MEIRETPFVLIARVMVKSGKVEEYMKIASTVDKAVEKTEPGMLFHHFDSDPANEKNSFGQKYIKMMKL